MARADIEAAYREARAGIQGAGLPGEYSGLVDSWLRQAMDVMEKDPEFVKKLEAMSPDQQKQALNDPKVIKDMRKLLEKQPKGRRTRFG